MRVFERLRERGHAAAGQRSPAETRRNDPKQWLPSLSPDRQDGGMNMPHEDDPHSSRVFPAPNLT